MTTENAATGMAALTPDAIYDTAKKWTGQAPSTYIFDKRFVLPLDQLPDMVHAETGQALSRERASDLVRAGWIPPLAVSSTDQPGFALYAPSRVGMLLDLERRGYTADELRALSYYEEGYIDNVLVNDETPYLDDDRELLLNEWAQRLAVAQARIETVRERPEGLPGYESEAELEAEIDGCQRSIAFLQDRPLETMSPSLREKTERWAYQVRFCNEIVRVSLLDHQRQQTGAGYSPYLVFQRSSFYPDKPPLFEGIVWDASLPHWAIEDAIPIRLPALRIDGQHVTLTRPMRPADYQELWHSYRLDEYFNVRAALLGERRCHYCHGPLDASIHEARMYCSDEHKNAARMQRWRQRSKRDRGLADPGVLLQ